MKDQSIHNQNELDSVSLCAIEGAKATSNELVELLQACLPQSHTTVMNPSELPRFDLA
jgi:hypothetical protein